ncbi:MAG: outer membrane beta-barrel family protein [Muribaculaceae bacterium]|nr:outer membrane beta-barrel family protein [Muribaculaceae bacterium]
MSLKQIDLGEIGLLKEPKRLDEVTVTASRIKLYYDGDTLVYNADAFLLPEGSMLDDLIRKLDGVSINTDGEIFCNGRKVESLMLDGRKLFNGNPRMLMQNLGAYTVKKIKVYDYTSKEDKLLGYSATGKKPMVMDVVLKQEYSIGKWVNLDAGYGTSNRYLARLFALGFTKTTAFAAFANINNLSTGDNPTRYDQWHPGKAGRSDSRYISGGLTYQYDTKKETFRGEAAVNTDKVNSIGGRESVNYLSGGNTYQNYYFNGLNRNLEVTTNHYFNWIFSKTSLTLTPKFEYTRKRTDSSTTSATFDEDMDKVTAEDIEAIYSGDADRLLRHTINRNLVRNESDNNRFYGSMEAKLLVRLPEINKGVNQNLTFNANGSYRNSHSETFNRNTINYGRNPEPAYDVYALTRVRPSWYAYGNGSATYRVNIREQHDFSLTYAYSKNHDRNTSDRYLLSNLDQASLVGLRFAELAPDMDLSAVIDPDNSRTTRYRTDSHSLTGWMSLGWHRERGDYSDGIYISATPGLEFLDRRYDYTRPNYDTTVVRRNIVPKIEANVRYSTTFKHDKTRRYYSVTLNWKSSPSLVSMGNLINVSNTSNPLNIFRGNPDLRNGYTHSASAELRFNQHVPTNHNHTLSFRYTFSENSISSGYIYDPKTGVTVRSMYNINGYRNYGVIYTGNGLIFRRGRRSLNYNAGFDWTNTDSPMMVGVGADDGRTVPARRFRYSTHINPSAGLSFSFGERGHSVNAGWNANFNHTTSSAEGYQPMDLTYMNYKLGVSFGLPFNIRLATDANLLTRKGFDDPTLNSNEIVWNATASWYWKKKRLSFILDAYDILGQIKVISAYSNELGRTESWSNTLPRYVLLRLRYHLDISPK